MSENIYNPDEQFFGWTRAVNGCRVQQYVVSHRLTCISLEDVGRGLKVIKEIAMMNLAA